MVLRHIYTGNLQDVLKRKEVEGVLFSPILITSNNKTDLTPENIEVLRIGWRYLDEKITDEVRAIGTYHITQPPYELARLNSLDGLDNSHGTVLYGVIATPLKVNEKVYKKVLGARKAK